MKKCLVILFVMFSLVGQGQFANTQYVGNYNTVVSTTSELRLIAGRQGYNAFRLGYYSVADGGDALFTYDASSVLADDSGRVIRPTAVAAENPGRWIMHIDRVVNVRQFGAKGDASTDDLWSFNHAKEAAASLSIWDGSGQFISKGTMKIPGGRYYLSDSLLIDKYLCVSGEPNGTYIFQESQLIFPPNKTGIVFRLPDGAGNWHPIVENLLLKSQGGNDTTKHALSTNGAINVKNVAAYFFGGNGFNIETGFDGNANNFKLESCVAYYNLNGFYFHGNESNNGTLINCDATGNARCNFADASFLGNNYYGCHSSATGGKIGQKSIVFHFPDSLVYTCIANNINVEPGVTPGWQTYWNYSAPKSGINGFHTKWNDSTYYHFSASYAVTGAAAASNFYGCYAEGEGSGPIFNQFTVWWGGILGDAPVAHDMIWFTSATNRLQMRSGSGIRVADKDSFATAYSALESAFGLELGTTKAGYGNFQAKFFESDRYTKFFGGNSTGNLSFKFTGQGVDPAAYGRTGSLRNGLPSTSQDGLFFNDVMNGSQIRNVSMSSSMPNFGSRGTGDFSFNTGSDTTIIGWKVTTGGASPVWKVIKTGNAPMVKYTPSSTNDSNGNEGDKTYDDNFLYIKTSEGWKRTALATF